MMRNVNTPAKMTSDGKWPPAITRNAAQGRAEAKGRPITKGTQWRRSQCGRRDSQESAGHAARHKRTIRPAITARVPPSHKMFVAPKLRDVDRSRAAPVILEYHIGHEAWRQNHSYNQENHSTPWYQQLAARHN